MTTLTSSPASDVLARMQADVDRQREEMRARFESRRAERAARDPQPEDWRVFFEDAKDLYLAVRPETAKLLYILARTRHARTVVEFGTSFGLSTLCLAAAVRDNGGGRVIGTEFLESKAASATASLAEAGLDDLVEIRIGDAMETLARDVPPNVDILFLDGAKHMYLDIVRLLEPRLSPGALVIADNSDSSPELLEYLRGNAGYLSSATQPSVEVALRIG
ncbi:O-methyltransferase [Nocardia sp. alder85J]|uniref:O-methyltransferase n=1 Tax=Nocardia sp. alder85J TaxID=2862949 RepID=UPI001CD35222|nr:class I SAM-dependent methyltransferase [Nocardia sp. alder85J]MCX4093435.1 class I SAM-dependent methyltransferase [Nocardia sp. alder85J]